MRYTENAIATAGSVTIASRFMKLLFSISAAEATAATFLAACDGVFIKLEKTHPSYGTKTLIYRSKLTDLLEIAACNEGAVTVDSVAGTSTLRGTIELSDDGALEPMESEQFKFSIDSLPAGYTAHINTIDVPVNAVTVNSYNPVVIQANAPSTVNVVSSKWLAIPRNTLTSVELVLPNGRRLLYTPDELLQICKEANEFSYLINGAVTQGSRNLYIINVSYAVQAIVTCSSIQNVYVVNVERL